MITEFRANVPLLYELCVKGVGGLRVNAIYFLLFFFFMLNYQFKFKVNRDCMKEQKHRELKMGGSFYSVRTKMQFA